MAVIQTVIAKNGTVVRIHDDACAIPGSEQEKRIIEDQRRAAWEIMKARAREWK